MKEVLLLPADLYLDTGKRADKIKRLSK